MMNDPPQDADAKTPYNWIGGAETVARLVDAFYSRVLRHPDLAPIFPADIGPVRDRQLLFLTQFLGGPPLFSQQRGQPMLRARHMPHPITPVRADAWLSCMAGAMDEIGLEGPARDYVFERLTLTAKHMINTPQE